MLCGVMAVVNKYTILVLLDIGFVTLFLGDLNTCKTSKHAGIADVLLFIGPRFLWDKLSSLTFCWKSVSKVIGGIHGFSPEV